MKTSKIIFISLLSAIALIILVAMADIRLSGKRNSGSQADFKIKKQVLLPFKLLSINNCRNVTLVQNDSSFIEVIYLKDSIAPDINFTIREDTLMLSDFEKLNHRDVLLRLIDLLEKSDLLILLKQDSTPTGYLTKPEMIYLQNTAENRFVVQDDIEMGYKNFIPLWLFGFLY